MGQLPIGNGSRVKSDRLQGATVLLQSESEVDAWGRTVNDKRTTGAGQFSETRAIFDTQQRQFYVSVPGTPGSGTTIKTFDAFGIHVVQIFGPAHVAVARVSGLAQHLVV
jgi:hypothetical protein